MPNIILRWSGFDVDAESRNQVQQWLDNFSQGKFDLASEYDSAPLSQLYLNAQPFYFNSDPSFAEILPALKKRFQHPPLHFADTALTFSVPEELVLDAFDSVRAVFADLVFYGNLYNFRPINLHFGVQIPDLVQTLNLHRFYRCLKGIYWAVAEFRFDQLPIEIEVTRRPDLPMTAAIQVSIERLPLVSSPPPTPSTSRPPTSSATRPPTPSATNHAYRLAPSASGQISDQSEISLALIGRTLPEFSSSFFDPYLKQTHSTLGGFPPEVSSDQLGRIIGFRQQFSHRIFAFEPVNRDCLLSALMTLCIREKLSLIANPTRDWKIAHLTIPEFLLSFSRYRLLMAIPSADFAEIDDFCRNQNLDCQLISSKLRSGLNHFFIEGFADCGLDEIRAWADHGS